MANAWKAVVGDTVEAWGPHVGALITPTEVAALAAVYGEPQRRLYQLAADEFLMVTRRLKTLDRRGEIAICLRRANGYYLLHTKDLYPGFYRLPTGGIFWHEGIIEALHREVREETGLTLQNLRFLAVIGYEMRLHEHLVPFVTYLWYGEEAGGTLTADGVEVASFSELPLSSFAWVAHRLRDVPPPREAWGAWRAIAHEVAQELLSNL